MESKQSGDVGIQLLLKKCKRMFRISENLDYYSRPDYKNAERKFVKYMLRENPVHRLSEI